MTTTTTPWGRRLLLAVLLVAAALVVSVVAASPAAAAPLPPGDDGGGLSVEINGPDGTPSSAVVTLLAVSLLGLAPALLMTLTSFPKILVVLSLARSALGTPTVPPTMVLTGLALFLSLFIMGPVLGAINEAALQPYLDGGLTFTEALDVGQGPLREFMLAQTRESDIALMTRVAGWDNPQDADSVPFATLVPAFLISELRAAFVIGFVIFVPFLVIDFVVAAALQSLGMMMLPPTMISLPFKILVFILVDGWGLITTALVGSYN